MLYIKFSLIFRDALISQEPFWYCLNHSNALSFSEPSDTARAFPSRHWPLVGSVLTGGGDHFKDKTSGQYKQTLRSVFSPFICSPSGTLENKSEKCYSHTSPFPSAVPGVDTKTAHIALVELGFNHNFYLETQFSQNIVLD